VTVGLSNQHLILQNNSKNVLKSLFDREENEYLNEKCTIIDTWKRKYWENDKKEPFITKKINVRSLILLINDEDAS